MDISNETYSWANQQAVLLGRLNNSITAGQGNLAGFIGKKLVSDYLGAKITKTANYDFVHNNRRIEVKTKRCTSPPQPHYECSIDGYNPDQLCDDYVFVRVLKDYRKAWILGIIPQMEYFEKAVKYKAGETQAENNFVFHCDAYNLRIDELKDIDSILPPTKIGLDNYF